VVLLRRRLPMVVMEPVVVVVELMVMLDLRMKNRR
jgi:hypothetical protein